MDRQHHCGAVQYGTIKLSTLALASSSTNPDPTLSIQLDTDSDLLNSLSDFKTIVGSALNRDYRWKLSKSFPTKIIISLDSRKNIWRREARGELIFSKWPRVIIHRQSSIRLAESLSLLTLFFRWLMPIERWSSLFHPRKLYSKYRPYDFSHVLAPS